MTVPRDHHRHARRRVVRTRSRSRTSRPWRSACRRSSRPAAGRRRRRAARAPARRRTRASWSKVTLRAPGSLTSGEIDAVFGRRPERAGDEARLVRRVERVRGLASRCAPPRRSSRRPGAPARSRPARCDVAPKVLVSMMSAPAARYCSWISRMTSGRVSTSRSLLPFRSTAWSREALAAILRLGEPVALDHRAHGAVEDQDAAREQFPQAVLGRRRRSRCGRRHQWLSAGPAIVEAQPGPPRTVPSCVHNRSSAARRTVGG